MLRFAILKVIGENKGSKVALEFGQEEIKQRLVDITVLNLKAIRKILVKSYSEDEVVTCLKNAFDEIVKGLKGRTVTLP